MTLSADQLTITRGFEQLITWARRVKPPQGLSASAFTTLDTLSYAGPLRISELADREGITQPGMTTLVNRLENDGLAVRAADPSDGRAALVSITESGRARVSGYRSARAAVIGARIAELDAGDQAVLLAAVGALQRLTAAQPASTAGQPASTAGQTAPTTGQPTTKESGIRS